MSTKGSQEVDNPTAKAETPHRLDMYIEAHEPPRQRSTRARPFLPTAGPLKDPSPPIAATDVDVEEIEDRLVEYPPNNF